MTKRVPQVSVIVPTYNERDNLAPLAERIFATLDPNDTELLIVDDDSPDGTGAVAEQLGEQHPVRCIVRRNERGLATAVIRGLREARGEFCVVMDADLSHPPEAIPKLLEAMGKAGTGTASEASGTDSEPASAEPVPVFPDMAIGSRFIPGGKVDLHWPLHRRLNSWVARLLARPLTGVQDMMSGFFCVRRGELDFDRLNPVGYKIALELIVRHRWKNVLEIPITFADRAAGKTKLNVAEQLRYLRHLWRLYGFVLLHRGIKTR